MQPCLYSVCFSGGIILQLTFFFGGAVRQVLYHRPIFPALLLILRQDLAKLPRLAWNLQSTCLSFLSNGNYKYALPCLAQ